MAVRCKDASIGPLFSTGGTYDATTAYTLALWLRGRFRVNGGTIFQRNAGAEGAVSPEGIAIRASGQESVVVYHADVTGSTVNTFSTGQRRIWPGVGGDAIWWHLALTWSTADNLVRLYSNGQLNFANTNTRVPTTGGTRLTLVLLHNGSPQATASDVRWWTDRALSPSEVRAVMAGQPAPRPTGWWAVGAGAMNGVDRSGNGNHLTVRSGIGYGPSVDPNWVTSRTLAARLAA